MIRLPSRRTFGGTFRRPTRLEFSYSGHGGGVVPIPHLTPRLGCLKRRRGYDDQKEIMIKIRVKIENSRSNIDHVNGFLLF
jgi:hypothetical protein